MTKAWVKLFIASLFEIGWVVGIAHSTTALEWSLTGIGSFLCFYFLIDSTKYLPVGTSYAVFVGLGASGVTLFDFVVFHQPFNLFKIILIIILLIGVIGLTLVTDEEQMS